MRRGKVLFARASGFSWRTACLAGVAAVTVATSARADDPTNHDRAVTYFEAARRLVERGQCAEAVPRLFESVRAENSVGARLTIGDCMLADGREADAWNQYKAAEQLAIAKADAERTSIARDHLSRLDLRVIKVRLVLPERARVTIDGVAVPDVDTAALSSAYALAAGTPHAFEVASGERTWKTIVPSAAGGTEVPAVAVFLASSPVEARTPFPPPPNRRRTVAMALAAGGATGLAVGGVFASLALVGRANIRDACGGGYPGLCAAPRGSQDSANETLRTHAGIATVGFLAGAALLGAAAVLYWTAPRAAPRAATFLGGTF